MQTNTSDAVYCSSWFGQDPSTGVIWFVSMSHPPALWRIGHIGPLQQSGIFAARLAAGPAARVASKAEMASSEMSLFVIEKS
jgi:hypothetical protein